MVTNEQTKRHWVTMVCTPGSYSLGNGADTHVIRTFAVPVSDAAKHVAAKSAITAEIYPGADEGDMTPVTVIEVAGIADLQRLNHRADQVDTRLREFTLAAV